MKLHEIIKKKYELGAELRRMAEDYNAITGRIQLEINGLNQIEAAALNGLNIDYVQLAESVIYVNGDPYAITDPAKSGYSVIAYAAINDIATGCKHLKSQYYGNKTYSGYYQRCDCSYGMGPSHGSIKDRIGLKDEARKRDLTSDEMDACIYYLKNYKKISEAKKSVVS